MFTKKRLAAGAALVLCGMGLGLGLAGYQLYRVTGNWAEAGRFFYSLGLLRRHFAGEIDDAKLFRGAIDGMLKATGDPYTVFLDAKDFAALDELRLGCFGGIGVVFGRRGDEYIILSVLEDNPGARAGVKPGERILAVDGRPTREMHMDEVAHNIRGDSGTAVELTLGSRDGKTERRVQIVRGLIKSPSVLSRIEEGQGPVLGYVRIGEFNENTGADFRAELAKLTDAGMQGLILDLRYNPGGLLQQAVSVGNELVPAGPLVSTVLKDGSRYEEKSRLEAVRWPLAVLVNEGSASAAEIVAGAVQDTKAGVLVGTKTFGKGCVQTVYPLPGTKTGLKITIAKYYTPNGVCLDGVGLTPDMEVALPEDAKTDIQLEAAKKYLREKLR